MARPLMALCCFAIACAKPAADTGATTPVDRTNGRWTMLNTPISYHFWNDSVETVMYPPQAPAPPSFRVVGDSVRIIDGSRTSSYPYALRGDTLFFSWTAATPQRAMTRIGDRASSGIIGSWRHRSPTTVTVLTFRSDSALVMELGVSPWPQRRGDTVSLRTDNSTVRLLFHHANGRLIARSPNDGRYSSVSLVRRPWGCFGIAELDRKAKECR